MAWTINILFDREDERDWSVKFHFVLKKKEKRQKKEKTIEKQPMEPFHSIFFVKKYFLLLWL